MFWGDDMNVEKNMFTIGEMAKSIGITTRTKERSNLAENDQLVKIKLDKSRIRHYEGTPDGERMKELGRISLRMVKILLGNGSIEVLATNLSQTEFHTEEIKELYHMRWG